MAVLNVTALPPAPATRCAALRDWLLAAATTLPGVTEAVAGVAHGLASSTWQPDRVTLAVLPTEATLDGLHFIWCQERPDAVDLIRRPPGFLQDPEHLASPLHAVFQQRAALRIRRSDPDQVARFPFVRERFAAGVTDYVAVPLPTRRRLVHILTLSTQQKTGFDESILDSLHLFSSALGLVVESFEMESLLAEKETLLREIHHRVKNNLQMVSSLLAMQSAEVQDEAVHAALLESMQRVEAMSLIHQQLYGRDSLAAVDLAPYIEDLVAALERTYAPGAPLRLELAPVRLRIDDAIVLGLILNELVTNALKYGVGEARHRDAAAAFGVRVRTVVDEDGLHVEVEDRGPGLPADWPDRNARSLGMKLVQRLTKQLRGTFTPEEVREGGTRVRLDLAIADRLAPTADRSYMVGAPAAPVP